MLKALFLISFVISQLAGQIAFANIVSEKVEYKEGENKLEGFIVYDSAKAKGSKKLPGMVIMHNWMGVGEYVIMRAEQMAALGYVAFVADIYGQGIRPKDAKEASALATKYKEGERKPMRARSEAALTISLSLTAALFTPSLKSKWVQT